MRKRKLRGKLLRHGLACRLIARKRLVAEGLFADIERHRGIIRPADLRKSLVDHADKAVKRVCREPVRRIERTHAVKRAVEYTVSVEDQRFFHHVPPRNVILFYFITARAQSQSFSRCKAPLRLKNKANLALDKA